MSLSGTESGIEKCCFFKEEGLGDLIHFFNLYGESNYTLTSGRLAALGKSTLGSSISSVMNTIRKHCGKAGLSNFLRTLTMGYSSSIGRTRLSLNGE